MNILIREAVDADLDALLELYLNLHEKRVPEDTPRLRKAWTRILADPGHHIVVCEADGKIVSSCTCVVVPNLTRDAHPYALIENVVTHRDYRKRGLATRCLERAREIAGAAGCYKIMLMTGAKDAATLRFYRRAGFNCDEKTAFIQRLCVENKES